MRKARLVTLAALMSLATAGSAANAAIIPLLQGSPTATGTNYNWDYDAVIGNDFRVKAGDFFTLYDFGYVVGHTEPPNWVFSTAPVGPTPLLIVPDDDPLIPNITYTYTGPTQVIGTADLGHFILTLDSNLVDSASHFGAQATRNGGTQDGRFGSDYGEISGPAAPDVTPFFPEPTAMATLFLGAPVLLRRRQSR